MNNFNNIMEFKVPKKWKNELGFGVIRKSDDKLGNYFEFDFFEIPDNIISSIFKRNFLDVLGYKILDFIYNVNMNYLSDYAYENLSRDKMLNHFELILLALPKESEIRYFDDRFRVNISNEKTLMIFNPFGDEYVKYKSFERFFKSIEIKLKDIINILNNKIELDEDYFQMISKDTFSYKGTIKDLIYFIYKAEIKKSYYQQLTDTDFCKIIFSKFRDSNSQELNINSVKRYFQIMKADECIEPSVINKEIIINDLNKIFSI